MPPSRCFASIPTPSTRSHGLRDGRTATAGADGRIAIWTSGKAEPDAVLEGHTAPIVALAASPDGTTLASSVMGSHGTAVAARGRRAAGARRAYAERQRRGVCRRRPPLISVSYDQSVRIWPLSGSQTPTVVAMPTPLNSVAIGGDGEIAVGGADGKVYFLAADGARAGEVAALPGR